MGYKGLDDADYIIARQYEGKKWKKTRGRKVRGNGTRARPWVCTLQKT